VTEEEQERLFDRFFPADMDPAAEAKAMAELEASDDGIGAGEWRAILTEHLGRGVMDETEKACVEAACRGEDALASVLSGVAEYEKAEAEAAGKRGEDDEGGDDEDGGAEDSLGAAELELYSYASGVMDGSAGKARPEFADGMSRQFASMLEESVLQRAGRGSASLEEEMLKASAAGDDLASSLAEFAMRVKEEAWKGRAYTEKEAATEEEQGDGQV
jgi:hypothetical protein